MSMIDRAGAAWQRLPQFAGQAFETLRRGGITTRLLAPRDRVLAPVLPQRSRSSAALILVIAIMTFLAGLTAGAVMLVADASRDWSNAIAREVTIQVRPVAGRSVEADVVLATDLARRERAVVDVRVIERREGEKMLEPWLGTGLDLSELPVPRLIVLRLAGGGTPDLTILRSTLAERVPNALIDDHQLWLGRLKAMANSLVLLGLLILTLVLVATALAVAFATRGAMAGTAHIIDVLHLVGAEDRYIAHQFQSHFVRLGLRGGMSGGLAAILFFLAIGLALGQWTGAQGMEPVEALFGRFSLPLGGYVAVFVISGLVAFVTGLVSRITVFRTLRGMEENQ